MLTLLLSVCGLTLAVLSVIIIYANYKEASNRWLSIFMFSGVLWMVANLAADKATTLSENLLFSRLTMVGAALVPLAYLFFCVHFTRAKLSLGKRLFSYVPIAVLLGTVPTKWNVISINANDLSINPGPAYVLLLAVFVGYFWYGATLLLRDYRHARQNRHQQLYYILTGTVLTIVPCLILSVLLPLFGVSQAASFSPIASLIFSGAAAVAILKHHLFDIRLFVIRAAAYGFSVVLISLFYLLPSIYIIAHVVHVQLPLRTFVGLAAVSLLLTVAYRYLRRLFDRLTKRIFYRHYYEPQDVLDRLSDLLAHTIDITRLQQGSRQIIVEALGVGMLEYWLGEKVAPHLSPTPLFHAAAGQSVVVLDELSDHHALVDQFRAHDIAAVVRLRTTHGELGYMVLGFKRSGEPYSQKDKRLLSTIADEIAISLQNALHFSEIQNFNKTLQERVNQATNELRRTNEKLRALDETKDEFITMASHQLRTPLTSVKGYLSMVLEGDAGKLNAQQKQLLTQSFISSQRMVYLIADLLNLSRLNTGKFVIEPTPVDLSEVVQGEIDQLQETAKSRDLTLVYKKPASFPLLNLDETKIHQVVMNFIDNAIYYTPSGGIITISLSETPTAVEYRVVDNGIGVPKAEQHRLFSKFYRAGNARRARPDGTGLGLFMAKKVIAAQGGAVIFESEEGKGSTFGFRFSKAKHQVHEAGMAAAKPTP